MVVSGRSLTGSAAHTETTWTRTRLNSLGQDYQARDHSQRGYRQFRADGAIARDCVKQSAYSSHGSKNPCEQHLVEEAPVQRVDPSRCHISRTEDAAWPSQRMTTRRTPLGRRRNRRMDIGLEWALSLLDHHGIQTKHAGLTEAVQFTHRMSGSRKGCRSFTACLSSRPIDDYVQGCRSCEQESTFRTPPRGRLPSRFAQRTSMATARGSPRTYSFGRSRAV